jgi:hypothetical protein
MNGLERIIHALNELAARFRNETDPNRKRMLLGHYVELIQFIVCKAYGWSPLLGKLSPDLRPLDELGVGLMSLNQGEISELLAPAKRPGRRSSRKKQFFWANGAALIDLLMTRFGKDEEKAARAVAEQLRRRGLLFDTARLRSPAWKLLQTWRDKIRNGEKGALARAWYDEALLFAAFYPTERELYEALLDPNRLPFEPLSGKTA